MLDVTGLLYFVVGYLFGSIPFGLVLTRIAGTQDIRTIGSGNIGATNVLRTGSKPLATATLICDGLKGALPVWLFAGGDIYAAAVIGLGAFIGHLFPIWLKFKGGKGIATYVGLLLALSLPALIAFGIVWIVTAIVSRYSSLAALAATLVTPLFVLYFSNETAATLFAIMSALAWFMHRENIKRLLSGNESRIGSAK